MGSLFVVRRQFELSAASLGSAAVIELIAALARRLDASYIALFMTAALVAGAIGALGSWLRARHALAGAVDAPEGWSPPTGGTATWVGVLALPPALALLVALTLPDRASMVFIILAGFSVAAASQVLVLARSERRTGLVLVSESVYRVVDPLKVPASEMARLESGRAASGAAR